MGLFERLGELVPGIRPIDDRSFAVDLGGAEVVIELEPAEGVIASAAMPVLDGLSLRVRPDVGVGNVLTGHRAFDHSFRVDADDPELARLLLDEHCQIELAAGRHAAQTVVVANRRVDVLGAPLDEAHRLAALRAAAALAARPYHIVRKLRRALRRWGPVPSGEAWDVTSFRLALTMPTPSVHLAWRQRPMAGHGHATTPRLQTRVVASRRGTAGAFTVIDAQRVTPPALGAPVPVPLDVPDVVRGRYLLLADRATDAHDDLAPHLSLLGGALPLAVVAEGDSVAVVFDGFEEQRIALEPALALARGLASTASVGPYR